MTTSRPTPEAAAVTTSQVFVRDGYIVAETQYLTLSDLRDRGVHDLDDNRIGAIRTLLVGPDDAITDAIVDMGGFFGMGVRSIRVPFGDLTVLRKAIGTDLHVVTDLTEDQIRAMPPNDE